MWPSNPFVTSDVWEAQNCGKMDILRLRVATLSSFRACRMLKTVVKWTFWTSPSDPSSLRVCRTLKTGVFVVVVVVLWLCFGGVFVVVWWCGGVLVFLIKVAHHDRPWFCSGLHHVAYVPAATHVRTADAGKVVELSVTRHHTASLVWLMRKFSVWNFHGSKVYARDMKN